MSPKKDNSPTIRAKIASNLDQLAQFLIKKTTVLDVAPLHKAAFNCRANNSEIGVWKYSVENLIFRKLGDIKVFQREFDVKNATIVFSMAIEGKCEPSENEDPLLSLGMSIFLSGDYISGDDVKTAYSSWHLDRHNSEKEAAFFHPSYHFSFGGMHLEEQLDAENAPVLLADTPRIAHFPMDAILGVDFILTNFWQSSLLGYRAEGVYVNLVGESQKSLWKPYVDTLYGFWQENPHKLPWSPYEIIPQLMDNR
jgi:hypothetical protein